ncbi:MAG: type II secretion system GspH family protein [Candidatus Pacebacteria bacterium]|nr:type II secretion system GspH family protein [Candidatus Paceibacterota bacterium]
MSHLYIQKIKRNKNSKGFTLIELLVVIAIIALLASVVLSSLGSAKKRTYDAQVKSDMNQVRNALELYATDNNYLYPITSMLAVNGAHNASNNNTQSNTERFTSFLSNLFVRYAFADTSSNLNCQYFDNLETVLVPKYIGKMPRHPLDDRGQVCYKYFASLDGTMATAYGSLVTETYSGGINKQAGVVVGKTDLDSLKQICADNVTVAGTPFPLFSDGGANQCDSATVADIVLGVTNGEGDLNSSDSYSY